jgi:hypothetical protein
MSHLQSIGFYKEEISTFAREAADYEIIAA